MKVKKGDLVIVVAGKSKGVKGKILKVLPAANKCVVEGAALVKKHVKATSANEKSQIISKEAAINISNVMYFDEASKKGVRLGYKMDDKGKKVRYIKATNVVVS
jgi:large subunit ribosomal protein L24